MMPASSRSVVRLSLLGLGLLLAGCPSVTTMTTAKPIGHGKNDITFSPTAYGFSASALGGGGTKTGLLYSGALDLMYRRGIGNHFDLGVSLTGFGLVGIDGKINLLDTRVIALSLDPGVGGVFAGFSDIGGGYLELSMPILLDIAFSEGVRLTLGPKYIGLYSFAVAQGSTVSSFSHLVGGSLGLELKLGSVFRLLPHGAAVTWANKPQGVSSVFFAGGIACKFVF